MTANTSDPLPPDPNRIGSRMSRINPDIFRNQSGDGTEETAATEENGFIAEPIDDEGKPTDGSDYTGNDRHQDDNYALGGHVTRTRGV